MNSPRVSLAVLPVEALTTGTDRFKCEPYHAVISARTCLARRGGRYEGGRNQHPTGPHEHESYPLCSRCDLGAKVAERVTAEPTGDRCDCGRTVRGAGARKPVCAVCRRARAAAASKKSRAVTAASEGDQ